MPTYEYKCTKCGYCFEEFQKMSAAPTKACPKCRGRVKRLIGAGAGFLFKGSGFYATDYRSKDYKKHEKEEAKREGKPTEPKKEEVKGESKPAETKKEETKKKPEDKGEKK